MKTRLLSFFAALAALVLLLPMGIKAQIITTTTHSSTGSNAQGYSFDTSYICVPHSCQAPSSVSGPPCNLSHSLGVRIALTGGPGYSITNVTVRRAGTTAPDCFMACVASMTPNIATCGPVDESFTPVTAWNTQNDSRPLAITSTGPGTMEVDITCNANGKLTTYPNYVTIP